MFDVIYRYVYEKFHKEAVADFRENMRTRTNNNLLDFIVVILVFPHGKEQAWEMPFLKQEFKKRGMKTRYIKEYKKCKDKVGKGKKILRLMARDIDLKFSKKIQGDYYR